MLKDEIEIAQRLVKTDAYQMSVGELVNMYKNDELVVNPDFQRLYRWEIGQKSKLIESLLLGIPIPSIFVFERDDATWELVDGLQRISTLLEFMGELKAENGDGLRAPIALVATKYLPSLDKAVWEVSERVRDVPTDEQHPIKNPQQLAIKRSRLSVEILKRPSDNATKYDLFQRLNGGGTAANPQELRNCIAIMVNQEYAGFMRSLAESEDFRTVLSASEDQLRKQRDMEYVSRFLVHTYVPYDGRLDVEEYIDQGIVDLATKNETHESAIVFYDTFKILNECFGQDALRRRQNGVPTGRVGLAAFECIAIGIAKNIASIESRAAPVDYVRKRIEEFWAQSAIESFYSPGLRGTVRIQRTISFGSDWFSQ